MRLLLALIFLASADLPADGADCPASHATERVRVIHVTDGDTVKLADGRRLRIIGINAPEIHRPGHAAEAFAAAARTALERLLDSHNRTLLLQTGKERRDHYGRLLAHAFLETGENIAVQLLEQGLATTLVVPPNTWGQACYRQAEDAARLAHRGLWQLAAYRATAGRNLTPDIRGFRIVNARVTDVRYSSHAVWIDLEGPLVIRVARDDLAYFEPGFPENLHGRNVEVRGWIKQDRKDGLRISARHPAAIRTLAPAPVKH
ncbi:MAG: thermonuclease family protein [Gammaproteobacteria bacterium]